MLQFFYFIINFLALKISFLLFDILSIFKIPMSLSNIFLGHLRIVFHMLILNGQVSYLTLILVLISVNVVDLDLDVQDIGLSLLDGLLQ